MFLTEFLLSGFITSIITFCIFFIGMVAIASYNGIPEKKIFLCLGIMTGASLAGSVILLTESYWNFILATCLGCILAIGILSLASYYIMQASASTLIKESKTEKALQTRVVDLNTLAILEHKFFAENNRFTANPNKLNKGLEFKKNGNTWTPEGDALHTPDFTLKTKKDKYMLSATSPIFTDIKPGESNQGIFAIKGKPNGYLTFCFDNPECSDSITERNSKIIENKYKTLFNTSDKHQSQTDKVVAELGFAPKNNSDTCILNDSFFDRMLSSPLTPVFDC